MNLDGTSGLYLLNVCVDKVVLVNEADQKSKAVCLQAFFWGLPIMNIYQAHRPNEYDDGAESNVFTNFELGTTGYFYSATIDLIRSIQRHPIMITVFKDSEGADTFEAVGTCKVKVTEKFSELISRAATCAVKHAVSGVIKGVYNVMNKEHIQVGTISVTVRLVCYDNSLLKAPYVPSNQNDAVGNRNSKYLLPKKTSDGFVLVPAEGPGESFTELRPNEQGLPIEHPKNKLWPQIPKGATALSPIDVAGLVCDTTMSERFFNADQSNDSFISQRRGHHKVTNKENLIYNVEPPPGKQGGFTEDTSPFDDFPPRKMTIETYFSDSGTDTKRRTFDGGRATDSATRTQEHPQKLTPVKIYGKEGSVEGSRHSSLPASPAQESFQHPAGFKNHSYAEDHTKKMFQQADHMKENAHSGHSDFRRKSVSEYVLSAFAPRAGLKKTSCDPFNYEYSEASQRICEKYLKKRQEKANTASKPFKKQASQNQVSEMSFEQMEKTPSPIPFQYNRPPCPAQVKTQFPEHPVSRQYPQNYPSDKAFERHHQADLRSLTPPQNQSPNEISSEVAARHFQMLPSFEEASPKPFSRQQSFIRQNCVHDEHSEALSSHFRQVENLSKKQSTEYQLQSELCSGSKSSDWQYPQYPRGVEMNSPSAHLFKDRAALGSPRQTCPDEVTERGRCIYPQSERTSSNQSLLHSQDAVDSCPHCTYADQIDSSCSHIFRPEYQNLERYVQQTEKTLSKSPSRCQSSVRCLNGTDEKQPSHYPCSGKASDTFQYETPHDICQETLKYDPLQYPHADHTSSRVDLQYQPQQSPICSEEETARMQSYAGVSSACKEGLMDCSQQNTQCSQQVSQYSSHVCPDEGNEMQSLNYPLQHIGRTQQEDEAPKTQSDYLLPENVTRPAFGDCETENGAIDLYSSYQSTKAACSDYQKRQNAGEESYPSRQQTFSDEALRDPSWTSSSHNYNAAPYGFDVPITETHPEPMKCIGSEQEIQSDTSCQPTAGWNAQGNGGLDIRFGGQNERQQIHPYCADADATEKDQNSWSFFPNGSCNEESPTQTAQEQTHSLYADERHMQRQPAITDDVHSQSDSVLFGIGRNPQCVCLLPADCALRAEASTSNPEPVPRNSHGATKNDEQESPLQYQPSSGENILGRENYSHLSSAFRSPEKERGSYTQHQEEMEKTAEQNNPQQCAGFQPYRKDSRSKQLMPRSRGGHIDTRHLHARRACERRKHVAKQQEYAQHRAQLPETKTEKPKENFGCYGAIDISKKPSHSDYPRTETAVEQQQSSFFSQCQKGKPNPEAAALGTKAGSIEQTDIQSPDSFLDSKYAVKYNEAARWQSTSYANACANDDSKVDESSELVNETARCKSRPDLDDKFSGLLGDPRNNQKCVQETPSVLITPVGSSGNSDSHPPFRWEGMHAVGQNTDNKRIDKSVSQWGFHRSCSEIDSKTPIKTNDTPRPASTPVCNAPGFLKDLGGTLNTGYPHYGTHRYCHNYQSMISSPYGSYGGQTFVNACAAGGCASNRCMWSNCHTC